MAISTQAALLAAPKQKIAYGKALSFTGTGNNWNAGLLIAGTLPAWTQPNLVTGAAPTQAATGYAPVAGDTGFPTINNLGAGNYYLSKAEQTGIQGAGVYGGRVKVMDVLFAVGAVVVSALTDVTVSGSLPARVPGSDYKTVELWMMWNNVTITGTPTITCQYTNQDGTTGQVTPAFLVPTAAGLRAFRMPLAAGDTGISALEKVSVTTASTAGSLTILLMRTLSNSRVLYGSQRNVDTFLQHGLPQIYATSAIAGFLTANGSNNATWGFNLEIVNG